MCTFLEKRKTICEGSERYQLAAHKETTPKRRLIANLHLVLTVVAQSEFSLIVSPPLLLVQGTRSLVGYLN